MRRQSLKNDLAGEIPRELFGPHVDDDPRKKHEEMGFHEGWGIAWDQLVTMVKTMGG